MKILLLQPPIQDFYDTNIRLQPMGLAYLKATIQLHHPSTNVVIKDYHSGFSKKTIPYPSEMSYLKNFYIGRDKGPFSSFDQYYHFGADFDYIISDIKNISPDLIGISSLFSPYYQEVLTIAQLIKDHHNIPIIIGGPHATVWPDFMLKHDAIDFVIRGEGEKAFTQFIFEFINHKKWDNVQNLSYKQNNQIIHNPIKDNFPIDEIPFPDFKDLDSSNYELNHQALTFMLSSRGCPYQCDFCSINSLYHHQFFPRDPDKIITEMTVRYKQGYRVFDFEDDNLTYNKKRALELFNKITSKFQDRNIKLVAMNGISYLHLDLEILSAMKNAGFDDLNLSLVSYNKELSKLNSRPVNLEKFQAIVLQAKQLGFNITAYQIIGHPEDSLSSMIETLSFMASLPVLIGASIFYLIKDTGIEKRFPVTSVQEIKLGRLTSIYQKNYPFNQSDIFTLFITTRIINFLKSGFCQKGQINLSDLLQLKSLDGRPQIGMEQLRSIIFGSGYYIHNKKGKTPVNTFNSNLFRNILKTMPTIMAQDGQIITNDI
ncbi:MAG: hypothetical protein A2381_16135 [Bdellovibrionales bacterium RIFOXYB1_FULL_37_110]|nr:MAG: hypothetical protein A2417_07985 [Bdellovibrionales bacterium RIFOXYC1_FULL_37_79]OFZ57142.1 MAG: hypothetical protein A2381_16135 [Bdellovibrionales bacterium RIFOXYB1_FULL_37_110]OFZ65374.1 MAG: hypothetical protein A2577_03735 [Bdellovibrionales bacterium RIFOXYD1_FULL_36_51]